MKFDWSVISSSRSKYGTFENEQSRASDRANMRELHVSTPYEFLVPVKTTHAPNPTPSLSLPPTKPKKFPVCSLGSLDGQMSHWIALQKVSNPSPTSDNAKVFPCVQTTVNHLFKCKYSETWLSAHLQDLPKGPLIRGCSLDRGLWKSHNVC